MNHINAKVVLITGASQGIGRAAATFLASHGAKVVLLARNEQALIELKSEIEAAGGNAVYLAGDVAQFETFERANELALKELGPITALINNAGLIDPIARIADSNVEEWTNVVDVNLKGVYFGIRSVLPNMLERGGGHIINISSGAATSALEGWSHYCSTKAAVLSLTRCVHKEYASKGIKVVGLSPGTVATGMQKSIRESGINPVSQLDWSAHIPAEWVAKAIGYLLSEEAADLAGDDFSLKNEAGRQRVGLPLA